MCGQLAMGYKIIETNGFLIYSAEFIFCNNFFQGENYLVENFLEDTWTQTYAEL